MFLVLWFSLKGTEEKGKENKRKKKSRWFSEEKYNTKQKLKK
jgi:hypothetical protein